MFYNFDIVLILMKATYTALYFFIHMHRKISLKNGKLALKWINLCEEYSNIIL